MTSSSPPWETLIGNLRPPAPRRLLVLMILARAQRGGPANVFRYRDLDEPLRRALAAFGPGQRPRGAEQAFWRLRNDGFWRIHDEARLAGLSRGPVPSRRLLLAEDAAAEVPAPLWRALSGDAPRVARLVQAVLEGGFAPELRGAVLAEVVMGLGWEEDE